jgi:hypothetical protein
MQEKVESRDSVLLLRDSLNFVASGERQRLEKTQMI